MTLSRRQLIIAVSLIVVAGVAALRESSSGTASAAAAEEHTPVRVDSVFPIEEEIRRFRAPLEEEPTALSGGVESREALVERFVRALETADLEALGGLALTRAEFAYLYYPHTRFTRRPYELSPALVWFQQENYGGKGLNRALSRYGNQPLGYIGHRCADEPVVEERNRIWTGCVVERVNANGTREALPLLGPILERDGRFKFVSFANRL